METMIFSSNSERFLCDKCRNSPFKYFLHKKRVSSETFLAFRRHCLFLSRLNAIYNETAVEHVYSAFPVYMLAIEVLFIQNNYVFD
jgi:hypothetical protein